MFDGLVTFSEMLILILFSFNDLKCLRDESAVGTLSFNCRAHFAAYAKRNFAISIDKKEMAELFFLQQTVRKRKMNFEA